jgi:hypothetical protein
MSATKITAAATAQESRDKEPRDSVPNEKRGEDGVFAVVRSLMVRAPWWIGRT